MRQHSSCLNFSLPSCPKVAYFFSRIEEVPIHPKLKACNFRRKEVLILLRLTKNNTPTSRTENA